MTYRNVRSYEIGPVYGAVTEDFLPVLGIPHYYKGYSDTPPTEDSAHPWNKLTVLGDGFGNLVSLKLVDGDFEISGALYDPPLPSLWDKQDGAVISRLVYKEDVTMPYIGFGMHEEDHRKITFPQGVPKWVLETNLGRTQFCIFYWLRVMARFPERLSFAYENLCDPIHYEMAQNLVSDLKKVKQQRMFESTDSFSIVPSHFHSHLINVRKDENGNDACELNFDEMGLKFHVSRFDQGKIYDDAEFTEIYTEIFNKYIFDLLPVFQRYHVLTELAYGMYYLKGEGLKPSDKYFYKVINAI